MADPLHADIIQQLEVALLGSPAAQVIDLLSGGWVQTKPVPTSIHPHSQVYTSTPPAPASTSVPVLGVSSLISTESMPHDESLKTATESQDVPMSTPQHHHIIPTPVQLSDSPMPFTSSTSSDPSTKSTSYPVVVVHELTIPAEAYPEHTNWPVGGEEYLCHLCTFRHSKLDCILTHIRKHLNITISCPVCGKRYQNVASLCKHGRDVHSVQIVVSADVIPTEEY